jgi:hypothetical protein
LIRIGEQERNVNTKRKDRRNNNIQRRTKEYLCTMSRKEGTSTRGGEME